MNLDTHCWPLPGAVGGSPSAWDEWCHVDPTTGKNAQLYNSSFSPLLSMKAVGSETEKIRKMLRKRELRR